MLYFKALILILPFLFISNIFANDIHNNETYTQSIKEKKIYPKGKKIFEKLCNKDLIAKDLIANEFKTIHELKSNIINKNLCKKMSDKNLDILSIYLIDLKKVNNSTISIFEEIIVDEKERCPVCAMFVAKYPRWAAQVFIGTHKFSFDGVKDLMKFYFEPQTWGNYPFKTDEIKKILVTDYYTQEAIDGFKAYYVIRSDVYGPMGHELIPFESLEDATIFKKESRCKRDYKI